MELRINHLCFRFAPCVINLKLSRMHLIHRGMEIFSNFMGFSTGWYNLVGNISLVCKRTKMFVSQSQNQFFKEGFSGFGINMYATYMKVENYPFTFFLLINYCRVYMLDVIFPNWLLFLTEEILFGFGVQVTWMKLSILILTFSHKMSLNCCSCKWQNDWSELQLYLSRKMFLWM